MSDLKPWRVLRTQVLLDRPPWLRVVADDVALPDGRVVTDYLRLETPDYVVIVPLTSEGTIAMVRSYKHGVGDIDLQPPAGYLEPEEPPLKAAQRELLEETGCAAGAWHPLGVYTLAGNRGAGRAHLFLAAECRQVASPDPGDLEEQQVVWLPVEEARRRLTSAEFGQLATIAALSLALDHPAAVRRNRRDRGAPRPAPS